VTRLTYEDLRRIACWAPVLFAPVGGAVAVLVHFDSPVWVRAPRLVLDDFLFGALVTLVLGYVYVALVLVGEQLWLVSTTLGERSATEGRGRQPGEAPAEGGGA
jgi:hypothetical protein